MAKVERVAEVVGVSGPTGAGKDYLSIYTRKALGLKNVTMLTTRPRRPEGAENKIPIPEEEFLAIPKQELVGLHNDTGIYYAYKAEHLRDLSKGLIELNPNLQASMPEELKSHGIEMVGWIGLWGEEEYLISNIRNRQNMGPDELETRLRLSRDIMKTLRDLHQKGTVTHLYQVGWHNRETMAQEFSDMVRDLLGK